MTGTGDYLVGKWRYFFRRFARRIWFRASLYSFGAVLVALVGAVIARFVEFPFELELAADAVDNILTILASSMLAVTTFSLSIMVSAYSAAASNSTPRATHLLIEDSVASNTLSTFVGSFLFAVVGIVGLSMQIYGDKGRVVLFLSTLVVLFLVTASLLRWIEQLTRFGRVSDTIKRVEEAGSEAARDWGKLPRLGAEKAVEIPEGSAPLYLKSVGYIQHIDVEQLDDLAASSGGALHLVRMPGRFISPNLPVAYMENEPDIRQRKEMAGCFTVMPERSFNQDPRYGLIVLSEIASRALSPAVNDPGTAIQVMAAGIRVIHAYCDGFEDRGEARFTHIHAPDIPYGEMLEDFVNPIARDGAGLLEVQLTLQRSLETIALANRELFGEPAKRVAALALKRSLTHLDSTLEQSRLRRRADWALPDDKTGAAFLRES